MKYTKLFEELDKRKLSAWQLVKEEVIGKNTLRSLRNDQPVSMYSLEQISRFLELDITSLFDTD